MLPENIITKSIIFDKKFVDVFHILAQYVITASERGLDYYS